MTFNRTILTGLASFALPALVFTAGADAAKSSPADVSWTAARPASLPLRAEHRYRMLGKVRPLLFWISKDDVGGARITWRGAEADAGYELLIGSDPARAPRGINRWGYIAEEKHGSDARVLGVMKESAEESIEDAEKGIAQEGQGGFVFKAIQGTTSGRESQAGISTVHVERDLTFRDLDPLIQMLGLATKDGGVQSVSMPEGAQPGFLTALAELIHANVDAYRQKPGASPSSRTVPYAYNGVINDMTLRSSKLLQTTEIGGKRYTNLVRSSFDTKSRTSGRVTRFEITYGASGSIAEIPVHAVYQPRWWLEVQLFLDDAANF
jgi:hypothetical protein